MVQTSSQLVPEAAVAARYQHSAAVTVRHVAAALAGNQLGEGEDQQGGEGDDGDDLADEESGGHAGEASVNHRVRGLSTSAADCAIYACSQHSSSSLRAVCVCLRRVTVYLNLFRFSYDVKRERGKKNISCLSDCRTRLELFE